MSAETAESVLAEAIQEELSLGGDAKSCAGYGLSALKDTGYTLVRPVTAEEEAANTWLT